MENLCFILLLVEAHNIFYNQGAGHFYVSLIIEGLLFWQIFLNRTYYTSSIEGHQWG